MEFLRLEGWHLCSWPLYNWVYANLCRNE